ncbi:MAG: NAD-dependent dehydratase, partial [Bacillaceae bacterium G1]
MKVLIAGANGHTGRLIVERLGKSPQYEAYAMIRDAAQAETLKQLGAKEAIVADLEGDVSHAVKGMDAVIFAAGSGSKTGPDKTISVDQEGAKRLIDAAKKAGIAHFVMLSSYGAGDPDALPNLGHYLKAKGEADRHLIESGLTYT